MMANIGPANIAARTEPMTANTTPRMRELPASLPAYSLLPLPRWKEMQVVTPVPTPSPAHIMRP